VQHLISFELAFSLNALSMLYVCSNILRRKLQSDTNALLKNGLM
jgi:hypothetical protein